MKNPLPSGYLYPLCLIVLYAIIVTINEIYIHDVLGFILGLLVLGVGIMVPLVDPRVRKKVGW